MKTKWGLSGAALKWLAVILMAIDHFGASIMETYLMNAWGRSPLGNLYAGQWSELYAVDRVLRMIGRPAFPIFCFLLVEGFLHTKQVKKYILRMLVFVCISEIPFDLALHGVWFDWNYQSVYVTLLIGLVMIWVLQQREFSAVWRVGTVLAACVLAELVRCDYGAKGIVLIAVLFLLRDSKTMQSLAGAVCTAWELPAPAAFLPIWFYNGERGRQPKWFFYWFYPIHLLLYGIAGKWILPMVLL